MERTPSLVYITDPMCSWCYAFGPQLEILVEQYPFTLEILMGGLRPGPGGATPLNQQMKQALAGEWKLINTQTGMPFDFSNLERQGWMYDTELPARAVVAVRGRHPEITKDWLTRLQTAFYAEAQDITGLSVYPALIREFPSVDPDWFLSELSSENSRKLAWQDFSRSRNMGVTGYPTLMLQDGHRTVPLNFGYRPASELFPLIDKI